MPPTTELTPEQARDAILNGQRVRMHVGTGPDDPVLVLHEENGKIISEAVAGWSAGVVEPVCFSESDYLLTTLSADRPKLELEGGDAVA